MSDSFRKGLKTLEKYYRLLYEGEPSPDDEIEAKEILVDTVKEMLKEDSDIKDLLEDTLKKLEEWDTLENWFKEMDGLVKNFRKILGLDGKEEKSAEVKGEPSAVMSDEERDMARIRSEMDEELQRKLTDEINKAIKAATESLPPGVDIAAIIKTVTNQVTKAFLKRHGLWKEKADGETAEKPVVNAVPSVSKPKDKLTVKPEDLLEQMVGGKDKTKPSRKTVTPAAKKPGVPINPQKRIILQPKITLPKVIRPKKRVTPAKETAPKIKVPEIKPPSTSEKSGTEKTVGAPAVKLTKPKKIVISKPKKITVTPDTSVAPTKSSGTSDVKKGAVPIIKPVTPNKPSIKPVGTPSPGTISPVKPIIKPSSTTNTKPVIKPVAPKAVKSVSKASSSPPSVKPVIKPVTPPTAATAGTAAPKQGALKPVTPPGSGTGAPKIKLTATTVKPVKPAGAAPPSGLKPVSVVKPVSAAAKTPGTRLFDAFRPDSGAGKPKVTTIGGIKAVSISGDDFEGFVETDRRPVLTESDLGFTPKDDPYKNMTKDQLYQELIAQEGRKYALEKAKKEMREQFEKGKIPEVEFRTAMERYKFELEHVARKITEIRNRIQTM